MEPTINSKSHNPIDNKEYEINRIAQISNPD